MELLRAPCICETAGESERFFPSLPQLQQRDRDDGGRGQQRVNYVALGSEQDPKISLGTMRSFRIRMRAVLPMYLAVRRDCRSWSPARCVWTACVGQHVHRNARTGP
jgi:hypothetical protein